MNNKIVFNAGLILPLTLLMLCIAVFCFPTSVFALAESQSVIPTTSPASKSASPATSSNAFTPAGAGTVTDNATDNDGKEFFTITTEDGNVFYLVVDRQRNGENVYLLNAVTERELLSLAQKDGDNASAIPEQETKPVAEQTQPEPTPEPEQQPEPPIENRSNGMLILIPLLMAVGGVGYYFKIYKPKQAAEIDEDDIDSDDDEDGYYDDESEESENSENAENTGDSVDSYDTDGNYEEYDEIPYPTEEI